MMDETSEVGVVTTESATPRDDLPLACSVEAPPTLEALRATGTLSTSALTASWVDAVAQSGSEQLIDLEALLAAPATQDVARDDGRDEEGQAIAPAETSRRGGKRGRSATTTTVSATSKSRRTTHGSTRPTTSATREASLLFRRSQHTLRRAAATINMREITEKAMSQTLTVENRDNNNNNTVSSSKSSKSDRIHAELPLITNGGKKANVGVSPSSAASLPTPASPLGPWSPTSVEELTQNFLATVERQRRERVARLLPREGSSAHRGVLRTVTAVPVLHGGGVMSNEESNTAGSHAVESADGSGDELVIGEDEDAIWLPPGAVPGQSSGLDKMKDGALREGPGPETAVRHALPAYLTANSQSLAASSLEAEEASQREVARALARKHEMWKLRQRQLRARQGQQVVVTGDKAATRGSAALRAAGRLADSTVLPSPSLITPVAAPRDVTTFLTHVEGSGNDTSLAPFATAPPLDSASSSLMTPTTTGRTTSVRQANLSDDVISMIRRVNSFEHTSSQHIVVFDRAPRK